MEKWPGAEQFTRDQIKSYLEQYKNDKDQAIKNMKEKAALLKKEGKTNVKKDIQAAMIVKKQSDEKEKQDAVDKEMEKKIKRIAKQEIEVVDVKKLNEKYPDTEYFYDNKLIEPTDEEKKNLNIVIIGHVDSGKSTLTGHLLYELGQVSKGEMRQNEKQAALFDKATFEFAFVMDETEEERKRGVTIDVTTR